MIVIAIACLVLFLCCFAMTREKIKTVSTASVGKDFKSLLRNKPWWILIGAALCFNLFNTVRGASVAYFFADVIGADANIVLFGLSLLFYAGIFLSIGEVANMVGVALCVPIANTLGKKTTFMLVNLSLIVLSVGFFFLPLTNTGYWLMLLFQVMISILTGIMSPLVWSMYADVSDYAELKFKTASTGLIFSSSSMAQKFGGAIGGAAVMWLLSGFGYIVRGTDNASAAIVQPDSAISCLWWLMSFIPAIVAALSVCIVYFYPLTTKRVDDIVSQLSVQRGLAVSKDVPAQDVATDFADTNI